MQLAIGVESPKFAYLAKRHVVPTAFHETKIGSVWLILNCAFGVCRRPNIVKTALSWGAVFTSARCTKWHPSLQRTTPALARFERVAALVSVVAAQSFE
mmetsp:Transcript_12293/g.14021  ORF Transcript_12293/g.14021 Transcript_12293/m.14021 type:complete len:99 (+) Transcript_12293:399-695(+)